MRTSEWVTTADTPPAARGSLLDRLGELERLVARHVALEPQQQVAAVPEQDACRRGTSARP